MSDIPRKLLAEALGTALLLAVVIGSGIMAERLAGGNLAIALLANTLATVGGLYILIEVFGPVSGAHFNPAVSAVMAARGDLSWSLFALYVAAQLAGAVVGAWLAHAMFDMSIVQLSTKVRSGTGQWLAEAVATAGLVLVILRAPAARVAAMVACYIGAAYWFTASTSFANPAAAFGRMFSDSFAGIAPSSVAGFVIAQVIGAFAGLALHRALGMTGHDPPPLSPRIDATMPITIYHNPECDTSRNTLAMIRNTGAEPLVVDYLKTPPGRAKLVELIAAIGVPVRSLLRQKGTPYDDLQLDELRWSDDQLIDFMVVHPILMNRPIVVTPLGTRLCRPSEAVLDILPSAQLAPFAKEDGEPVIDAKGLRVAP